jgi:uncharacterized protein (TIGR04255 family)
LYQLSSELDKLLTWMYSALVSAIGTIPQAPAFSLRSHQLAQVLCQVRFSPVLRIRQDDAIVDFQETIRETYPQYAKHQGISMLITPGGVQQQAEPVAQHRFTDADGAFTAVLAPDFVALETRNYIDVEDFQGRVVSLVEAVQQQYAPAQIHRLGLRFINELRLSTPDPKTEMREALAPSLLGAAGSDELRDVFTAGEAVLQMADDDTHIQVRHGLYPQGGTTVDPTVEPAQPTPEQQLPFYLLDIDAYTDSKVTYSVEGVATRMRSFNDDIRSFFAWAVNEDYRRTKLGQEDAAE